MTYTVFGETSNLAESINHITALKKLLHFIIIIIIIIIIILSLVTSDLYKKIEVTQDRGDLTTSALATDLSIERDTGTALSSPSMTIAGAQEPMRHHLFRQIAYWSYCDKNVEILGFALRQGITTRNT